MLRGSELSAVRAAARDLALPCRFFARDVLSRGAAATCLSRRLARFRSPARAADRGTLRRFQRCATGVSRWHGHRIRPSDAHSPSLPRAPVAAAGARAAARPREEPLVDVEQRCARAVRVDRSRGVHPGGREPARAARPHEERPARSPRERPHVRGSDRARHRAARQLPLQEYLVRREPPRSRHSARGGDDRLLLDGVRHPRVPAGVFRRSRRPRGGPPEERERPRAAARRRRDRLLQGYFRQSLDVERLADGAVSSPERLA